MNTTPRTSTACPPPHLDLYRTGWKSLGSYFLTFTILISFSSSALINIFWVTTVEASTHQVKLLEIPLPTGSIPKTLTFPLYEQESIQYFSAGLGKEERSLSYPPFPLKLIFVKGERAFLARVSVHIAKEDGTQVIRIPGKEVEGPWLFINIPAGTYVISGTDSDDTTINKTITVRTDKSTVVHFRWPK
jgi:hypothetical protein